jgi:hypothetical protein
MVALNAYSRERLAYLLRLLRPAPQRWVTKAQSTILEMLVRDGAAADATPLTETQLAQLGHALERDPAFRRSFDTDPVAAAEAAGWSDLARGLEREMRGLVALAERIAADDSFRAALGRDPRRVLVAAGVPSASAEPLRQALEGSDAGSIVSDVVAHRHEQLALAPRLISLLLRSSVFAEHIRNVAGLRSADTEVQ